MKNLSVKNTFWAIIACLLWATAFTGIKVGLKYSAPLSFAGFRFMISGLLLLPFTGKLSNYFLVIKNNYKLIFILSMFSTFIIYSLFYTGISMLDGSLAAILIGSSPLITAIGAHYFMEDDKMNWQKIISLFIGLVGISIIAISRKPWQMNGRAEFFGVILLLTSTTSGTIGNIIVAKNRDVMKPLIFTSAQLFIGGFFILLLSIPIEGFPKIITDIEFYVALIWLAFISASAFAIWFNLLNKPEVKVSDLNLWKFIIPVFGAILAWIILPNENPELYPVIGMFCVAIAIILYNYFNNKNSLLK